MYGSDLSSAYGDLKNEFVTIKDGNHWYSPTQKNSNTVVATAINNTGVPLSIPSAVNALGSEYNISDPTFNLSMIDNTTGQVLAITYFVVSDIGNIGVNIADYIGSLEAPFFDKYGAIGATFVNQIKEYLGIKEIEINTQLYNLLTIEPHIAFAANLLVAMGIIVLSDPLVIDMDGDGIELIHVDDSGVFFDFDNDGFNEKSGWVSPDDALLVFDKNGNGTIDGIDELFGDDSDGSSWYANDNSTIHEIYESALKAA